MPTFTVSIPESLKKRMDGLPEINWPEYLKQRFEIRLRQLRKFEDMVRAGKI